MTLEAVVRKYVQASEEFHNHRCADNPAWCPAHDFGCEEIEKIAERQDELFAEMKKMVGG